MKGKHARINFYEGPDKVIYLIDCIGESEVANIPYVNHNAKVIDRMSEEVSMKLESRGYKGKEITIHQRNQEPIPFSIPRLGERLASRLESKFNVNLI